VPNINLEEVTKCANSNQPQEKSNAKEEAFLRALTFFQIQIDLEGQFSFIIFSSFSIKEFHWKSKVFEIS